MLSNLEDWMFNFLGQNSLLTTRYISVPSSITAQHWMFKNWIEFSFYVKQDADWKKYKKNVMKIFRSDLGCLLFWIMADNQELIVVNYSHSTLNDTSPKVQSKSSFTFRISTSKFFIRMHNLSSCQLLRKHYRTS